MSNDVLILAKQRRAELQAELTIIERFIRTYGELKAEYPDLLRAPRKSLRSKKKKEMLDFVVGEILHANRPLTRNEVLKIVEDAGHVVEGGDKSRVLGTILWRSGRFVNHDPGYWPKGYDLT